jgi:hypothetical protein
MLRENWIRALKWIGVAIVVAVPALLVTFLGVIGIRPDDVSQGATHIELLQAARAPVAYRVSMTLDAVGWLFIGAELCILAAINWEGAPLRSALAAAMGLTQVIGSVGGFTRMVGIGDLAGSWTASGSDHGQLLAEFDQLERVIRADFLAGDVLQGIGFLAAGSAALAASKLPRRLSYSVLVLGVTSSVLGWSQVVGFGFLFPVLMIHLLLLIGLNLAFIFETRRGELLARAGRIAPPG